MRIIEIVFISIIIFCIGIVGAIVKGWILCCGLFCLIIAGFDCIIVNVCTLLFIVDNYTVIS